MNQQENQLIFLSKQSKRRQYLISGVFFMRYLTLIFIFSIILLGCDLTSIMSGNSADEATSNQDNATNNSSSEETNTIDVLTDAQTIKTEVFEGISSFQQQVLPSKELLSDLSKEDIIIEIPERVNVLNTTRLVIGENGDNFSVEDDIRITLTLDGLLQKGISMEEITAAFNASLKINKYFIDSITPVKLNSTNNQRLGSMFTWRSKGGALLSLCLLDNLNTTKDITTVDAVISADLFKNKKFDEKVEVELFLFMGEDTDLKEVKVNKKPLKDVQELEGGFLYLPLKSSIVDLKDLKITIKEGETREKWLQFNDFDMKKVKVDPNTW